MVTAFINMRSFFQQLHFEEQWVSYIIVNSHTGLSGDPEGNY